MKLTEIRFDGIETTYKLETDEDDIFVLGSKSEECNDPYGEEEIEQAIENLHKVIKKYRV